MPTEKYLPRRERTGNALCLSGGGFRATLFHAGALRRMNELGLLARIDTFVSVPGGSIINAVLATRRSQLQESNGVFVNLEELVLAPAEEFAARAFY